jgi:tetratricopeptide (TPR) repeat protein
MTNLAIIQKVINQKQKIIIIFCLVIFTSLIYKNVLHFEFANIDDQVYVYNNSHVQSGITLPNIIFSFKTTSVGFWHPLTWLSHMLDVQLYGNWAGGHHLTNLLLHIMSSIMLFLVMNKMTGSIWRSGFIAALFAFHPLNVESVVWVAERKNVLSTFLWMLTIYAYTYYAINPGVKRYLVVLTLFSLGLMAKPMLVTLPFVLLLLDFWPLQRIRLSISASGNIPKTDASSMQNVSIKRIILEKIPLFILIIPACIIAFLAEKNFNALPTLKTFPLNIRICNAIISYIRYIEKMIFPVSLSIYYPHPGMWPIWQVTLCAGILIFVSGFILWKAKRYPYLIAGWLWYIGTMVPVIGLVQIGQQAIADRYTYIPLIGLFIIIAWGMPELLSKVRYKKIIFFSFSAFFLSYLSFLAWQRCQLWSDNYALWDDVLKNSQVAFAYNFRGQGYAKNGQYLLAIADYNSALRLDKGYAHALNNRAITYQAIGKVQDALQDYNQAVNRDPKFADAYYNRGILHLENHQLDAAIADFTSAINIDPDMADYFNNRGVALRLNGQYEKSFADFNQALKINRNLTEAYFNLGIIYNIYKQYIFAIADFTEALRIKPQYVDAYFHRGISFASLGKYNEAIADYRHVLQINSKHIPALNNLGLMLKNIKRYEESSIQFKKVLQIRPNDQEALRNLKEIDNLKKKN